MIRRILAATACLTICMAFAGCGGGGSGGGDGGTAEPPKDPEGNTIQPEGGGSGGDEQDI